MERLQRNVRRALHANENRAAGLATDFARKGGADERVAVERARDLSDAVESPEPIVDTVDADLTGAASALLTGDQALSDDDRSHVAECGLERRVCSNRVGKLRAEERRGNDDQIGSADPLQNEITQAAAHRIAHEQRTGEHGDGRGDTKHDRHVGTPVIRQAAKDEPVRRQQFIQPLIQPRRGIRRKAHVCLTASPGVRSSSICPDSSLQPGDRLGHYEILAAIGKGGMGEVWKARDATLQREVAIKALPEGFAEDSDRLARLGREATLLAALNHPNIAAIYGLEEHQGTRFLVLELVEGSTLAELMARSEDRALRSSVLGPRFQSGPFLSNNP